MDLLAIISIFQRFRNANAVQYASIACIPKIIAVSQDGNCRPESLSGTSVLLFACMKSAVEVRILGRELCLDAGAPYCGQLAVAEVVAG